MSINLFRHKNMAVGICSLAMVCGLLTASITGCGNEGEMEDISESPAGAEEDAFVEGGAGTADTTAEGGQGAYASAGEINASEMFTERDLSGEYDAAEAEEISLSEGDVIIAEEGVYLLRGALTDGIIIVDTDKGARVQLVFDGVEIDNEADAAVYVKQADKVFLTLAEGSENRLTSRGYTPIDGNNIDGVIYAKSDLVINGAGSLSVNAVEGHGIVSRDDLKITGGSVTVAAEKQGLSGRDSVRIGGGVIQITSGKDGIHAENDENAEKGFVYIRSGAVQIISEGDGISAGSAVQVDSGTVSITAGGGSDNRTAVPDENGDTVSAKGVKASAELVINQVTLSIDSQDDAIHSKLNVIINGGELSLATGDDGIHADETAEITGGNIIISDSYEGIEGNRVEISGGEIRLYAANDGLNAAGGNDRSGFGDMSGGERFGNAGSRDAESGNSGNGGAESEAPYIRISGGMIHVRADGDGLDSNGDLLVSGGEIYISGPEDSANGALDYDGNGQITGGIVVAAGNSGMAMNFGETSTQGSILITTTGHPSETLITLQDSQGKELVSYTAECSFNSVVISCPELELGGVYTVTAGEERTEVALSDSLIYGSGMGGFGNGGRMHGGGMPEGERPQMP